MHLRYGPTEEHKGNTGELHASAPVAHLVVSKQISYPD